MRYQLVECVSRSATGEVWRAHDPDTGAMLAVKKPGGPAELSQIHHPNVVRVLSADSQQIVMDWIEGTNLEKIGHMDAISFETLVRQTLSGLHAIHQAGFLHLDLKPENIFVAHGDRIAASTPLFIIGDLGSVQRRPAASPARPHGSVRYMAPECFENRAPDERTDLYSLGCVLHFALTGKPAFEGELAPQVITAHLQHRVEPLPGAVGSWIDHLMSRQPSKRPANALQALADYPTTSN